MPSFPLSTYKLVGDLLFISGQIGQKDGQLVSPNLEEQLTQTIHNIKAILEENGMYLKDVVDVNAFLIDENDYAAFNEVYGKTLIEPYPTRTTVFVKALPLEAKVELKVIASKQ
jgi:2-iminobutanoate/2-iminopropanoate deaminase